MEQSFEGLHYPAPARRTRSHASVEPLRRLSDTMLAALVLCTYALFRLLLVRMLAINSDEPQHAHVAWAWSRGLVPYRDAFDNHMPLFHMLAAPLFRLVGETPDILFWLRLAMVPLSVAALGFACLIANALWGRQVALLSVALTAVCPLYLRAAGEFRTDVLWGVAWLAAVAVAVGGPWSRRRAWALGLATGIAFAVSLKSVLLVAALATAWLAVHATRPGTRPFALRVLGADLLRIAVGACVVPAIVVAIVSAKGGLSAMHYDVLTHNVLPALGASSAQATRLPRMLGLLVLLVVAVWPVRHSADPRASRRALAVASAAIYGLLLLGGWPLLAPQDNLPVLPLLLMGLVGGWQALRMPAQVRTGVPVALVLVGLFAVFGRHGASEDRTSGFRATLGSVLAMTSPDDPVLDDKGTTIFRRRPYYFALETITLERLRRGLLADDIPQRLVASDTHVVWSRRLPMRDRPFVDRYYLPLGSDVHVAGSDLGWLPAGEQRAVYVLFPGAYALLEDGARATLDGLAYSGPRDLALGTHVVSVVQGSHVRLVWAPAARYFATTPP